MTIDELLSHCQQERIVFIPARHGVSLYAPGRRVSRAIRAAIRGHRDQLGQLIERSAASVCPSPELHASWCWDTCYICQRLDAAMKERRPATRPYQKAG